MEEIVDSMKGGLTALRVQVADAVEAVDDHREACIGECARELAASSDRAAGSFR
jgi:hypothetical protein